MKKRNIKEFIQTIEEAKNPPEQVEFEWDGEPLYHWRIGQLRKGEQRQARRDDVEGLQRDYPKSIKNVKSLAASPEDKMVKGAPEKK